MKWLLVISVALAGAACRNREIKKLEHTRDAVCACKSVECAEAAMKQLPTNNVVSNARSQRFAREMLDCLAQLYDAQRPTADPDAETVP